MLYINPPPLSPNPTFSSHHHTQLQLNTTIYNTNTFSNPKSWTLSRTPSTRPPVRSSSTTRNDYLQHILTPTIEKVQEGLSGTSKEANKEVAKDSNAGIGTRASAAKDAASDKVGLFFLFFLPKKSGFHELS